VLGITNQVQANRLFLPLLNLLGRQRLSPGRVGPFWLVASIKRRLPSLSVRLTPRAFRHRTPAFGFLWTETVNGNTNSETGGGCRQWAEERCVFGIPADGTSAAKR
jgi:hypothetical protein